MSDSAKLLQGIPVTDDHVHFRPDGQMEKAVRGFRRHGGTRLVLVHTLYEDLVAVYRKDSLLKAVAGAAARGERSLTKALSALTLAYLEEETLREMPYGLHCLLDVDTPADLQRAHRVLARER